jgi:hypothetical protein
MCGDVQARAAPAFRRGYRQPAFEDCSNSPSFGRGRGFKCGTIIHESNQLAFTFAGLNEEQFLSQNRNLAVTMWDAEFDEKKTRGKMCSR